MNCDSFKDNISSFLDGDLPDEQADIFVRHAGSCDECNRELAAYRALLRTASDLEILPAPDRLWQSIESQLPSPQAPPSLVARIRGSLQDFRERLADIHFGPGAVFAGGLALLLLGILIGGNLMKPSQRDAQPVVVDSGAPEHRLVEAKAERYIEKSKILFLGLINDEGVGYQEMDYSMEQRVARNLLQESEELKGMISENKDARLSQLIGDLEMILWEIAALKETQGAEQVELIKSGIEHRGIMLKIYLNEIKNSHDQQL